MCPYNQNKRKDPKRGSGLSGWLIFLLLLSYCCIACMVSADAGVAVPLSQVPERIISLAPSNTEMLFALGLGDRIIGVTDYCNYPDDTRNIAKIGGFSTVSIEKVAILEPDLVVAAEGNNPDTIERIKSMGILVYLANPKSMDDIQKTLDNLGQLTGVQEKAKTMNEDLTSRSEQIREEAEKMKTHPSVAHVIWNDPIYVSGSGTFQDELIRISGGVNVFSDKSGHQIASVEEFVSRDPDILLMNSGSGMGGNSLELTEFFKADPRLSGLSAIKNNQVIIVDTDVADRAGPRLWDLLEKIAPEIMTMG